jgi:hypothetical protein
LKEFVLLGELLIYYIVNVLIFNTDQLLEKHSMYLEIMKEAQR